NFYFAWLSANYKTFQLVRRLNGVNTTLAEHIFGGFSANVQLQLSVQAFGTDLQAKLFQVGANRSLAIGAQDSSFPAARAGVLARAPSALPYYNLRTDRQRDASAAPHLINPAKWTRWFNVDTPADGNDLETKDLHRGVCSTPIAIQARATGNQLDVGTNLQSL